MFKNIGIVPHKDDSFLLYAIAWVFDTIVGFLHRATGFQLQLNAVQIGTNNNTTAVQGAKLLTNIGSTRKVQQVVGKEIHINADVAPMTMLISKLGVNRVVRQAIFYWVERDGLPRTITTNATQVTSGSYDVQAATTAITCAAGTGATIVVGTVLLVERTGELIRVTARVTDELTVTRGYGGTSAAIIAASSAVEEIRIVGNASAENSAAPNGVSVEPKLIAAYPQCFRKSIEAGRREINSENYGDSEEWSRQERDALEQLYREKEDAFLLSTGANTSDPTSTKGAQGYLYAGTNVTNQAGALDEASLDAMTLKIKRRNNTGIKNTYVFAGENMVTAMNGFARDYLRLVSDDTKLGLEVNGFKSSYGNWKAVLHPALGQTNSSVTAANRGSVGMAFFLNLSLCGQVHFKGGQLFRDKNVQTPGTDGQKDCWTEDCGFMLQSELNHGMFYGITG